MIEDEDEKEDEDDEIHSNSDGGCIARNWDRACETPR
jgi:hypothetical protein